MFPLRDNINTRHFPFINIILVLVNTFVFFTEIRSPSPMALEQMIRDWAFIPMQLPLDPFNGFIKIFSSMFLHGGWLHFIGNMLYLWIFGDNVEDKLGHIRYLYFYLVAGVCATLGQFYVNPVSSVPQIGASGAIAGILGAYFVMFPRAKVLTAIPIWIFIRFIELPAILFLGFWFLIQAFQSWGALNASATSATGGIAWMAHASGFLSGIILIMVLKKRR